MLLKIFGVLTLVLIGLVILSGIIRRHHYIDKKTGKEVIKLIDNSDFSLTLSAAFSKRDQNNNNFGVGIVFDRPIKNILIESAEVKIISEPSLHEFKLQEVRAVDGFHMWVEEKNGTALTFDQLPKHLKTVNSDIEAYYVYSWQYDDKNGAENINLIRVQARIDLNVEGKKYKIREERVFKLTSEFSFRNPIRFH